MPIETGIKNANMFRNYFISALRSFLHNKTYSIIYLVGLALGITSCLIIFLFVDNELKFDRIHPDYDRTYRITHLFKMPKSNDFIANTQSPLADAIRETMTGFEKVVKVYFKSQQQVMIDKEVIEEENFVFTEPDFFSFFSVEWIAGDQTSALTQVNSIVLTEGFARKHFSLNSAIGKSITLFDSIPFTITGLVEDPDVHTHLPYTALLSINSLTEEIFGFDYDQWRATLGGFFTYVKLNPGVDPDQFEEQFANLKEKYLREEDREMEYFFLQPVRDIHLNEQFRMDNPGYTTSRAFIIVISLVGILILIIASINVINLRTAHALKRSVEVGIRKVSGAFRRDLIRQFMFENLILVVLSVVISLLLSELLLNSVNTIFEGTISLELYASPSLFLYLLLAIALVTALTGFYPSVILSSFHPARVLYKAVRSKGEKRFSLRNILIVFQFIISLGLIMITLTISHQLRYMQEKDMGFRKNEIVNITVPDSDPLIINRLRNRLVQDPDVEQFSFSNGAPTSNRRLGSFFSYSGAPAGERYLFDIKYVDTNYLDLFDLELLAGSWFRKDPAADTTNRIVVNEAFVKKMGISFPSDAVGQFVNRSSGNHEIIGVIRDFHVQSLYNQILPVALFIRPDEYFVVSITYRQGSEQKLLSGLEDTWRELFPNELFQHQFLGEFIQSYYSQEEMTGKLTRWFALLAILITCLGIFGLVLFVTTKRIKEFGIRKVLGVTGRGIIALVAKDFILQIGFAFLIATPIACLFISKWMQNFAYHSSLTIWIFFVPLMAIVVASMIPVFLTTLKAANTNPAECLRYE